MRSRHPVFLPLMALTVLMAGCAPIAGNPGLKQDTLRAVYIASNAAQAVQDPATGAPRGASADIARELGRRLGKPVRITAAPTAADVIAAVQQGEADIGFVAPNPARMVLAYSQTYMLVQQSFLVRQDSPAVSVRDALRPGNTLGANTGDSVGTWLKANHPQAVVLETPDYSMKEAGQWLLDGRVAAFGGNRQRLGMAARQTPGLRLLPDNLYGVPQAVAVSAQNPALLAWVNTALDQMRSSGFLAAAVQRGGIEGVSVAPAAP